MSQQAHGIIFTEDGSLLMSSLEKTAAGWRVKRIRRWNTGIVKNMMLFHRGVIAAAPSHWKPVDALASASAGNLVSAQSNSPLAPHAGEAVIGSYTGRLSHNLLAVVPGDAFLCTIPLALDRGPKQSFVSVYQAASFYKIGIIIDGALAAVFTMAPASPQALAGHLGRIERYWAQFGAGAPFPGQIYLLGGTEAPAGLASAASRLDGAGSGIDMSDTDALAASGAALSGLYGAVPRFAVDIAPASLRKARTALYTVSAGLVLCALLACAALPVFAAAAQGRLASYKKQYQAILASNPDLKMLMGQNDSLARLILSAHDAALAQTRWAQMLQAFGTIRPEGVFLEMLGSDGTAASGKVAVAFSGWAYNESLVTGFIASLQKSGLYSGVSLSSLERNESSNVSTFRITCTLKLSAGSPAK